MPERPFDGGSPPPPSSPGRGVHARATARSLGKRAGHAVILVVALAFIGASAAEIIPKVFRWHPAIPPSAIGSAPSSTDCGAGVRDLVRALDRASGAAWGSGLGSPAAPQIDADRRLFDAALAPEWDDAPRVARACAASPEGVEAWAALLRLRRAHEEALARDRLEWMPLRRDLAARLSTPIR